MTETTRRLFFALQPTAALQAALPAVRETVYQHLPPAHRGRRIKTENFHMTLLFLGQVPAGQVEALLTGAAEVSSGCSCLDLRLNRVGFQPRSGIVWLLPAPAPPRLLALARQLRRMAHERGIPPEKRPYRPHLTLLRGCRLTGRTRQPAIPSVPVWPIRSFTLMETLPQQPYATVKRWRLAGSAGATGPR